MVRGKKYLKTAADRPHWKRREQYTRVLIHPPAPFILTPLLHLVAGKRAAALDTFVLQIVSSQFRRAFVPDSL